jgi:hypothetical protein
VGDHVPEISASQRLEQGSVQFEEQIEKVRHPIRRFDGLSAENRPLIDEDLARSITDLDNQLNRMTVDLKGVAPSERDYSVGELASGRADLGQVYAELRQKRMAITNNPEHRRKEQWRRNVPKSDNVVGILEGAIRTDNDTLHTGERTRALLQDDRHHFGDIDEELLETHIRAREGQSRIKGMANRALMHKYLSWIIVVVLIILLGLSVYFRFFWHSKSA